MDPAENETEVIVQLTSASNRHIKESSRPHSCIHCCHNVKLCQVYQQLLIFAILLQLFSQSLIRIEQLKITFTPGKMIFFYIYD